MSKSGRHIATMFVFLLLITTAQAKRAGAPVVSPARVGAVEYRVPNDDGRRGYVQAWAVATSNKLWEVTVFTNAIDPLLEEDVQHVYIKSMRVVGKNIVVADETDREYKVAHHHDPRDAIIGRLKAIPISIFDHRSSAVMDVLANLQEIALKAPVPVTIDISKVEDRARIARSYQAWLATREPVPRPKGKVSRGYTGWSPRAPSYEGAGAMTIAMRNSDAYGVLTALCEVQSLVWYVDSEMHVVVTCDAANQL